jgi:protocatechuate 4,5-dioxygenase alpha chain
MVRSFAMMTTTDQPIPGTLLFNGTEAMKGYALNKMCFSFNSRANREAFLRDEDAYMSRFALNGQQRAAIKSRNVLDLLAAGGNIYYLAKFAGIFHLGVQDIGAQQTGLTVDEFRAKLLAAGS